jgi:hypothetical protein
MQLAVSDPGCLNVSLVLNTSFAFGTANSSDIQVLGAFLVQILMFVYVLMTSYKLGGLSGCGLDFRVQFLVGALMFFFFLNRVQTSRGAHPYSQSEGVQDVDKV